MIDEKQEKKLFNRIPKRLRGLTLPELVVVMVIIGTLMVIGFNGYSKGLEQSRVTSTLSAFKSYESALSDIYGRHPSIQSSLYEYKESLSNGEIFSSEVAYAELVSQLNASLEPQLQFKWNPAQSCYTSVGEDAYKGMYALVMAPVCVTDLGITDIDTFNSKEYTWELDDIPVTTDTGAPMFSFAIVATGKSDIFTTRYLITDDIPSMIVTMSAGVITVERSGVNEDYNKEGMFVPYL